MNYNPNRISDNLNAIRTSDGVVISAKADGGNPLVFGVTLAAATRYTFPFGADRSMVPAMVQVIGVHMRWDNVIAFTATLEECSFPALWPSDQAQGIVDVSDFDTTIGNWMLVRPPTAYIEVAGGGTYTVGTGVIAVATAQQGGCTIDLSAWGQRRGRINLLTGATGGLLRFAVNGKTAT